MNDVTVALNRFGLGGRGSDPVPGEPRRWLLDQFDRYDPLPGGWRTVPSRASVTQELGVYLGRIARAQQENMPAMPGKASPAADSDAVPDGLEESVRDYIRKTLRQNYIAQVGARSTAALTAPAPFVERMVHFWSNHFAVSADKLTVIGLAGLLEAEAVRPHVLGRFGDMLAAVTRHPAMLLYLDQAQSLGPASMLGKAAAARGRRRAGLNENLAREILELHTLGVRSGYSQADVAELARALTGWTVGGLARGPVARMLGNGKTGEFRFVQAMHEPGARTILGRRYAEDGERQAAAVLADLAIHPATARHVATKLARHFAGDEPPYALVTRLERAFLSSGGDLATLYRALIDAPESWAATPVKFKTPWDWTISALRATDVEDIEPQVIASALNQLGQPTWRPGSPAGYADDMASWAGPDALMRRVEVAERLAGRAGTAIDARALGSRILPGAFDDHSAMAIARAESPAQGLALLLLTPEFMRR